MWATAKIIVSIYALLSWAIAVIAALNGQPFLLVNFVLIGIILAIFILWDKMA